MGRCALPVVIIHILTGTVLGTLAGLGVGGGTLLVLWLTLVLGMEQAQARIVNLLFFIPCAVICTLLRKKQGAVDIKALLPGILAGCISAAAFSLLGKHMELDLLKKLFGILLLMTGIRELMYKPTAS